MKNAAFEDPCAPCAPSQRPPSFLRGSVKRAVLSFTAPPLQQQKANCKQLVCNGSLPCCFFLVFFRHKAFLIRPHRTAADGRSGPHAPRQRDRAPRRRQGTLQGVRSNAANEGGVIGAWGISSVVGLVWVVAFACPFGSFRTRLSFQVGRFAGAFARANPTWGRAPACAGAQ